MSGIIRIQKLYKIYRQGSSEVRALNGISLKVNQGEFVAIVGHSGSGKTTLMNLLGCLDTPTSGIYSLDGRNVADLTDDQLSLIRNRHIGSIFQGYNLIPSLDALENVELPLIYRGMKREQRRKVAAQALIRVGPAAVCITARRTVRRPAAEGRNRARDCRPPAENTRRRAHRKPRYGFGQRDYQNPA